MNKRRLSIIKKVSIAIMAMMAGGFIYPYLPYLLPTQDWVTTCDAMPINTVTYGYSGLVGLMIVPALPIVFGWARGATYWFVYKAVLLTGFGGWCLMVGSLVAQCHPSLRDSASVAILNAAFSGVGLLAFWYYMRDRLKAVIEHNPSIWDFERMRYWDGGHVKRPDGKRANMMILALGGGLIGLSLSRLDIVSELFGTASMQWFTVGVAYAVGYFFIAILALGNLYTAGYIYRYSRESKEGMLVRELVGDT